MVKMTNCCRQQDHSAVANKFNHRFFWATMSPIMATLLWLSATWQANPQQSPTNTKPIPTTISQSPTPPLTGVSSSGNQIFLNGRTLPGTWLQQPVKAGRVTTYLSDGAFRQLIGVNFLNSSNPARQPVAWFSSATKPVVLATRLLGGYRYLNITNFAQAAGWQLQTNGNTLVIATPKAQVTNILESQQPVDSSITPLQPTRVVVDLDRPTPWQITQG